MNDTVTHPSSATTSAAVATASASSVSSAYSTAGVSSSPSSSALSALQTTQLSGHLYKRRGGFAKFLSNNWQLRYFTVTNDGLLRYYDEEINDNNINDTGKHPRGQLDLKVIEYELIKDIIIEGAPTNYVIQIIPCNGEEKWRLCAETKEMQAKWCLLFEKFVHEKHYRTNTSTSALPPMYSSDDEEIIHQKLNEMKRDSSSNSSSNIKRGGGLKISTKPSNSDFVEWITTMMILNSCIYMALQSSFYISVIYIAIANFVVGYTLKLRSARSSVADSGNDSNADGSNSSGMNSNSMYKKLDVRRSTKKLIEDKSVKPAAGSTFTQIETPALIRKAQEHTWCKCDYRIFQVRAGPDYNRFKKKAPTLPPLYDPIAVDVFCTKKRVDHAVERFSLPDSSSINTHHPNVPPFFVVQIQLPSEPPPSIFTTVEDGSGWVILMYFKITEDTCNQLKDLKTASPAVKLFAQWCEKAPVDATFRGRFKVICNCTNLEEVGIGGPLGGLIVSYNAKPVLIRKTGTIFQGPGYIEKDIHVYKFANSAKQCIHHVSSQCGAMYMQIGFVIEGRDNSELPECVFGCVAVNKPQQEKADFLFDDLA